MSIATRTIDHILLPDVITSPVHSLVGLALFLPGITVSIQRLHHLDQSGSSFLLAFTVIGIVLLNILYCIAGSAQTHPFSPDPLAGMPYLAGPTPPESA